MPPKTIFLRGKRISLVAKWDFTPAKTSADTENVISSPILNIRLQLTVELCVLIISLSVFHNKSNVVEFPMACGLCSFRPFMVSDFWVPENYY